MGETLDADGLDSVSAIKIAGRLSREFGLLVPISPFMFFAEPTLEGMVKVIERLQREQQSGAVTLAVGHSKSAAQIMATKNMKAGTQQKNEKKAKVIAIEPA